MTSNRISQIMILDIPDVFPDSFFQGAQSLSYVQHIAGNTPHNINNVGGGAREGSPDVEGGLGTLDCQFLVKEGAAATPGLVARMRARSDRRVRVGFEFGMHQPIPDIGWVFEGHQGRGWEGARGRFIIKKKVPMSADNGLERDIMRVKRNDNDRALRGSFGRVLEGTVSGDGKSPSQGGLNHLVWIMAVQEMLYHILSF